MKKIIKISLFVMSIFLVGCSINMSETSENSKSIDLKEVTATNPEVDVVTVFASEVREVMASNKKAKEVDFSTDNVNVPDSDVETNTALHSDEEAKAVEDVNLEEQNSEQTVTNDVSVIQDTTVDEESISTVIAPITNNETAIPDATVDEEPISTITAPVTAILYKNGQQVEMKDVALNLQIAQVIESWFKDRDLIPASNLLVTDELIHTIKSSETAIEFIYQDEPLVYGKRTFFTTGIFIPITGCYSYYIFGVDNNNYQSGPISPIGSGLEVLVNSISK